MTVRLAVLAVAAACGAARVVPQDVTVAFEPAGPLLAGDPVRVVATVPPGLEVELTLVLIDRYGRIWRSRATFDGAADGVLDCARDAPRSGSSWDGADALGPFRSLELDRDAEVVGAPGGGDADRLVVTLRAVGAGSGDEIEPATAEVTRWLRTPGVATHALDAAGDGLVGELFVPAADADRPRPALLVVGDANGGLRGQRGFAELFASRGYVVLALATFGLDGLPDDLQDLPLETCDRAIDWLVARPEVDRSRLGVVGGSKGGELALLLASRDARLTAVVAFAPSSVVWQGIPSRPRTSSWTAAGERLAFVPYARSPAFAESGLLVDLYSASLDAASPDVLDAAAIPIERARGAVLLLSGRQDALWPSSRMCRDLVDRARTHGSGRDGEDGRGPRIEWLDFEAAGHEVGGPGYGPARSARSMGGTAIGKARALADGWTRVLAFLERELGG